MTNSEGSPMEDDSGDGVVVGFRLPYQLSLLEAIGSYWR